MERSELFVGFRLIGVDLSRKENSSSFEEGFEESGELLTLTKITEEFCKGNMLKKYHIAGN